MSNEYWEILAYVGSVVIMVSFMLTNMKLLRLLNTIGCIIFLTYSYHYDRMPLVFLNIMIILVNAFYILRTKK